LTPRATSFFSSAFFLAAALARGILKNGEELVKNLLAALQDIGYFFSEAFL
jgi:hypothetical protein